MNLIRHSYHRITPYKGDTGVIRGGKERPETVDNFELKIELPYPPSGNHMWKHAGGKHYITKQAKAYYDQVGWLVRSKGLAMALDGRLAVACTIAPPDKRRRDLDNAWKVISDACTRAGLWVDDTLIDRLVLERTDPIVGGWVGLSVALTGATIATH